MGLHAIAGMLLYMGYKGRGFSYSWCSLIWRLSVYVYVSVDDARNVKNDFKIILDFISWILFENVRIKFGFYITVEIEFVMLYFIGKILFIFRKFYYFYALFAGRATIFFTYMYQHPPQLDWQIKNHALIIANFIY